MWFEFLRRFSMTKKPETGHEAWATWAESMQKMMGNPAALNPFLSGLPGLTGSPFAAMGAMAGMPGFAGAGSGAPLDAQSLMRAIDPVEIDRRIQDMRAVEAWLKLSQATLEMSIKTMEMQRDAYASFAKMRESADATMQATAASVKAATKSMGAKKKAAKPRASVRSGR
jgi:hypothetical protein